MSCKLTSLVLLSTEVDSLFRQTPMPYIVAVHMKQATTLLLLILPFVLVDTLKLKMIPLMFCIALIYMGRLSSVPVSRVKLM